MFIEEILWPLANLNSIVPASWDNEMGIRGMILQSEHAHSVPIHYISAITVTYEVLHLLMLQQPFKRQYIAGVVSIAQVDQR